MATKYEKHPAADLFPMMSELQFQHLKADIKEHGQREDIIVWCGLLIDGRNRLRACTELGIEPQISELMEETDPVKYVLSENLHRRHLTTNQRACVAAKLATLRHGDVQSQKKDDGPNGLSSIDDSAKLLNVSPRSVKRVKHVIENASKSVVAAVETDELKASLAVKFMKLCEDKKEQAKIVKEGANAVREYVASNSTPKAEKPLEPKADQEQLSRVNAEFTSEAVVANAAAIKSLKSATNPSVVISAVLKTLNTENITAIMLYCEELLSDK